jgi:hypothetical protein
MRKINIALLFTAVIATPSIFAHGDDMLSSDSKPCAAIAKTCVAAGFLQSETPGKNLWQHCMEPVLLGETVTNVTVDAATVKSCRTDKIKRLETELKKFQQVADEKSKM